MNPKILLLALVMWLSGCVEENLKDSTGAAAASPHKTQTQIEAQVTALLAQAYIDPLTDYIYQYRHDPQYHQAVQTLIETREVRCQVIAQRYQKREKTLQMLARLQKHYQYSCPQQVTDFAHQVASSALAKVPAKPKTQSVAQQKDCQQYYEQGDYANALKVCSALAKQGDARAQLKLGILYADGRGGIPKDLIEAYVWLSLAMQGGIQQAAVFRRSIAHSLSTEQLLKANDRVVLISKHFR